MRPARIVGYFLRSPQWAPPFHRRQERLAHQRPRRPWQQRLLLRLLPTRLVLHASQARSPWGMGCPRRHTAIGTSERCPAMFLAHRDQHLCTVAQRHSLRQPMQRYRLSRFPATLSHQGQGSLFTAHAGTSSSTSASTMSTSIVRERQSPAGCSRCTQALCEAKAWRPA
jgi:hypothetical protein